MVGSFQFVTAAEVGTVEFFLETLRFSAVEISGSASALKGMKICHESKICGTVGTLMDVYVLDKNSWISLRSQAFDSNGDSS